MTNTFCNKSENVQSSMNSSPFTYLLSEVSKSSSDATEKQSHDFPDLGNNKDCNQKDGMIKGHCNISSIDIRENVKTLSSSEKMENSFYSNKLLHTQISGLDLKKDVNLNQTKGKQSFLDPCAQLTQFLQNPHCFRKDIDPKSTIQQLPSENTIKNNNFNSFQMNQNMYVGTFYENLVFDHQLERQKINELKEDHILKKSQSEEQFMYAFPSSNENNLLCDNKPIFQTDLSEGRANFIPISVDCQSQYRKNSPHSQKIQFNVIGNGHQSLESQVIHTSPPVNQSSDFLFPQYFKTQKCRSPFSSGTAEEGTPFLYQTLVSKETITNDQKDTNDLQEKVQGSVLINPKHMKSDSNCSYSNTEMAQLQDSNLTNSSLHLPLFSSNTNTIKSSELPLIKDQEVENSFLNKIKDTEVFTNTNYSQPLRQSVSEDSADKNRHNILPVQKSNESVDKEKIGKLLFMENCIDSISKKDNLKVVEKQMNSLSSKTYPCNFRDYVEKSISSGKNKENLFDKPNDGINYEKKKDVINSRYHDLLVNNPPLFEFDDHQFTKPNNINTKTHFQALASLKSAFVKNSEGAQCFDKKSNKNENKSQKHQTKKIDQTHTKSSHGRRLVCSSCHYIFYSGTDLLVHRYENHSFVCKECDGRFLSKVHLEQHKATDHPEILVCQHCRFHTTQSYLMEEHLRLVIFILQRNLSLIQAY